jgi:hypothetical protein
MENLNQCMAAHGNKSSLKIIDSVVSGGGTTTKLLIGNVPHGRSWITEVRKVVGYGKSTVIKVTSNGASECILHDSVLHDIGLECRLIDWAKAALAVQMRNNPDISEIVAVVA